MLSSLPCFSAFCWSAIPTSCYIFNVFYSCYYKEQRIQWTSSVLLLTQFSAHSHITVNDLNISMGSCSTLSELLELPVTVYKCLPWFDVGSQHRGVTLGEQNRRSTLWYYDQTTASPSHVQNLLRRYNLLALKKKQAQTINYWGQPNCGPLILNSY